MDVATGTSLAAVVISAASLSAALIRNARLQGADRQRLKVVEDNQARHASTETVGALAGRMDELEHDMKTIAAALGKVAVVETKIDGLDRLMTRELDEIKHSLRGIQARGYDPPTQRGRRASTA